MEYKIDLNYKQCKVLQKLIAKQIIDIEENIAIEESFGTTVDHCHHDSAYDQLATLKEVHVTLTALIAGRILFEKVIEHLDRYCNSDVDDGRNIQRYVTVRDMVAYRVYDVYNNKQSQETVTIFTVTYNDNNVIVICDDRQNKYNNQPMFNCVEDVIQYLKDKHYIQ